MNKYAVGNYLIIGFDRIGTKLFTKIARSRTHMGAVAEGEQLRIDDECASFATLRVQHNSLSRETLEW